MPFMSYQASISDAMAGAGRLMKEGGAEAVKLEGGIEILDHVEALTSVGIPVMAHIGLKPQSVHQMGGYKIQGKTCAESKKLIEEALAFEEAGAYSVLLEGVAIETAAEITKSITIPTIGISSGPYCDGQVLVIYDLLGMNPDFAPRFVKKYADLANVIKSAASQYVGDVKDGQFPQEKHGFHRNLKIVSNKKN
jgi:3-methyl-2-oxobutanoate hydroxymethyltransferase